MYIGTYTGPNSKGIYSFQYDATNGDLKPVGLAAAMENPSFLALHPNRKFLYAVSEVTKGSINAYSIDPKTGALTLLNSVSSEGSDPCHLIVDRTGKTLLVANYSSGSAAAFPISDDGHLGKASSVSQHKGHGVNPDRQEGPHAHETQLSPDNRFVFVTDLGLDQIAVYRLDAANAVITPNDPPYASVSPGAGPRHIVFHPNSHFAYVVNEMQSTVNVFSYDAQLGQLTSIQVISTLPAGHKGETDTAELELDGEGRFLYVSNRGHDTIAVFAVDSHKGTLSNLQWQSTEGQQPRHFKIDPSGKFLLVANQKSNNVRVLKRDPQTGLLSATGRGIQLAAPVCMQFFDLQAQ